MGISTLLENGPTDTRELDRLADYVAHETRKSPVQQFDVAIDAATITVCVAHLTGHLPVVAIHAWIIATTAFGMRYANNAAVSLATARLAGDSDRFARYRAEGVTPRRIIARCRNVLSAAVLAAAVALLLLAIWSPFAFTAVVVVQAALTVRRKVTVPAKVAKATEMIDHHVSTTAWAQRWQRDRAEREAAAEEFLAGAA